MRKEERNMRASTLLVIKAALNVALALFGVAAELNDGGGGFWMLASVDPQRQVREQQEYQYLEFNN